MGERNPFLRDSDVRKESEEPAEKTTKRSKVARFFMRSLFGERTQLTHELADPQNEISESGKSVEKEDKLPIGRFKRLWEGLFPAIAPKDTIEKEPIEPTVARPDTTIEDVELHISHNNTDVSYDEMTPNAVIEMDTDADIPEAFVADATVHEEGSLQYSELTSEHIISYEQQFLPPIELLQGDSLQQGQTLQQGDSLQESLNEQSVRLVSANEIAEPYFERRPTASEITPLERAKERFVDDTRDMEVMRLKKNQRTMAERLKKLSKRSSAASKSAVKDSAVTKGPSTEVVKSNEIKKEEKRKTILHRVVGPSKKRKPEDLNKTVPVFERTIILPDVPEIQGVTERPVIIGEREQVNAEVIQVLRPELEYIRVEQKTLTPERPAEIAYETRHEVKRDQFSSTASTSTSVGGYTSSAGVPGARINTNPTKHEQELKPKRQSTPYSKAASGGMWAAIILVLFALLAYYVSR
jgi:hypothetical protein